MNAIYSIENGAKLVFQLNTARVVVGKAGAMHKEYVMNGAWTQQPNINRHMLAFIERTKDYVKRETNQA